MARLAVDIVDLDLGGPGARHLTAFRAGVAQMVGAVAIGAAATTAGFVLAGGRLAVNSPSFAVCIPGRPAIGAPMALNGVVIGRVVAYGPVKVTVVGGTVTVGGLASGLHAPAQPPISAAAGSVVYLGSSGKLAVGRASAVDLVVSF